MKELSLRESKPPLPWVMSAVKDAEKCIIFVFNYIS